MRPDIAKMVVYHKLARPTEGMPKNWYINDGNDGSSDGGIITSQQQSKKKKKSIVISIATVGALAAISVLIRQGDNINIDVIEDCWDSLQSIPKAIGAAIVSITSTVTKKVISSSSSSSGSGTPTTATATTTEAEVVDTEKEGKDEDEDSTDSSTTSVVAIAATIDDDTSTTAKAAQAHSIKPGTKVAPKYDVDDTWLDKLLTNIERSIKGIFNIKI
ncbi:hypothetical protein FRACYDRAFT_269704 [Fragilariopsis cylindrus CCMP1102]|uniref:Uncharacterized protein n=1 Tax=Fragilariopsis cylindrus CCMP1102 TaxID=635003 RepID=A0A1E7F9N4_9STRA|nr:hypothetical protein FRACYDRAFT_269704 [Fragilariopsis cylindrus CCMP1102]|eukprot:OEU14882.1 hypothetical protein FRACYDRAFT_269704 [Fragilariopsis cylindrus CCMP1102]